MYFLLKFTFFSSFKSDQQLVYARELILLNVRIGEKRVCSRSLAYSERVRARSVYQCSATREIFAEAYNDKVTGCKR
jgi:hypothetical protein